MARQAVRLEACRQRMQYEQFLLKGLKARAAKAHLTVKGPVAGTPAGGGGDGAGAGAAGGGEAARAPWAPANHQGRSITYCCSGRTGPA